MRLGGAAHLIAEAIHSAPEVGHFEAQDHVGFADQRIGAIGLVERMAGGKVHAARAADDGRLQRFGEIDQMFHAGGGACRRDRRARRDSRAATSMRAASATAAESPCGRRELRRAWECAARGRSGNGIFLQFGVGDEKHGHHRRRHGDLVGAHGRFGEVREAKPEDRPT